MTSNANELWLIDLDRTLLKTDVAFDELVRACAQEGFCEETMLREAKQAVELSGGSFDVIGYLATQGVGSDGLLTIYDAFVSGGSGEQLLYDDAPGFMLELEDRAIPHAILTYGARPWQTAKLTRSGLISKPHIITGQKDKGTLIRGWQAPVGYSVTTDDELRFETDSIVLVDDKAGSFRGIPADCSGYLVRRSETLLKSQQGSIPENIVSVSGLTEILSIQIQERP